MAKKIFGLMIVLLLMAGMTGISTWALFTDAEASSGNVLAAGTLDLKTDDQDGVTQTLIATNMRRGDIVGPEKITLKNSGSLTSSSVAILFSYIEDDSSPNPINMSADDTASLIIVTILKYNETSILTKINDHNTNGYIDVYDLANSKLIGLPGIDAGVTKDFEIAVQLSEKVTGQYQADGIDITMTFSLKQQGYLTEKAKVSME
jgi:predicted ribosomally synthesized peptide with SipW-like signal peptide